MGTGVLATFIARPLHKGEQVLSNMGCGHHWGKLVALAKGTLYNVLSYDPFDLSK